MHERLLSPYAAQMGAQVTEPSGSRGVSRLYELTVGFATAAIARACFMMPAVKPYAIWLQPLPRGSFGSRNRFSPVSTFSSDMLKWWPEPQDPVYGLGMNVASSPCCLATCLAISRNSSSLSATSNAGA